MPRLLAVILFAHLMFLPVAGTHDFHKTSPTVGQATPEKLPTVHCPGSLVSNLLPPIPRANLVVQPPNITISAPALTASGQINVMPAGNNTWSGNINSLRITSSLTGELVLKGLPIPETLPIIITSRGAGKLKIVTSFFTFSPYSKVPAKSAQRAPRWHRSSPRRR